MSENIEDVKNEFKRIFRNYEEERIIELRRYSNYDFWQLDAFEEMRRRKSPFADFLLTLSWRELEAIIKCELNVAELAEEIYQESDCWN